MAECGLENRVARSFTYLHCLGHMQIVGQDAAIFQELALAACIYQAVDQLYLDYATAIASRCAHIVKTRSLSIEHNVD